jgi:hypothetical protein
VKKDFQLLMLYDQNEHTLNNLLQNQTQYDCYNFVYEVEANSFVAMLTISAVLGNKKQSGFIPRLVSLDPHE